MKKWYDEKHNLTIIYMSLPKNVDEAVTINEDCSYTAVIAENRCQAAQQEAYRHILKHIENNDLEDGNIVQEVEKRCHSCGIHQVSAVPTNCRETEEDRGPPGSPLPT